LADPSTMTGVHEAQPGIGVSETTTGPEMTVSAAGSFEKIPASRWRSEGRGADPSTMTGWHSEQEQDGVDPVGTGCEPCTVTRGVGWHVAHGQGAVPGDVAWHWVHGAGAAVGVSRVAACAAPGVVGAFSGVGVPGAWANADGQVPGAAVVADACT